MRFFDVTSPPAPIFLQALPVQGAFPGSPLVWTLPPGGTLSPNIAPRVGFTRDITAIGVDMVVSLGPAFVATTAPTGGALELLLNGRPVTSIDLGAPSVSVSSLGATQWTSVWRTASVLPQPIRIYPTDKVGYGLVVLTSSDPRAMFLDATGSSFFTLGEQVAA